MASTAQAYLAEVGSQGAVSSQRTWHLLWAAVRARGCACTACGSVAVRRSGVRTPLALRCAGMRLWRCRDCSALFPLRRRGLD